MIGTGQIVHGARDDRYVGRENIIEPRAKLYACAMQRSEEFKTIGRIGVRNVVAPREIWQGIYVLRSKNLLDAPFLPPPQAARRDCVEIARKDRQVGVFFLQGIAQVPDLAHAVPQTAFPRDVRTDDLEVAALEFKRGDERHAVDALGEPAQKLKCRRNPQLGERNDSRFFELQPPRIPQDCHVAAEADVRVAYLPIGEVFLGEEFPHRMLETHFGLLQADRVGALINQEADILEDHVAVIAVQDVVRGASQSHRATLGIPVYPIMRALAGALHLSAMGSRKRTSFFFCALAAVLFSFAGAALWRAQAHDRTPATQRSPMIADAADFAGEYTLVTEPADGIAPVASMIQNASRSIDLVMYELEDPKIEALLAAREKAGVAVRVLLDQGYYGAGSSANNSAFDYFKSHGVSVRWSPSYFALTHQKTLVADDNRAFIMTFNLSPKYYASDRDFGIMDTDPGDVSAIESTFDADWNGEQSSAPHGDDLVWSPGSRNAIVALVSGAQSSLDIYNEEMQDPAVIAGLAGAAQRGVAVNVVMTAASNWSSAFKTLTQAGVHIRTFGASAPLYIHAKVIIADDTHAFVGSENFSASSLDNNRELGIVLDDPPIISSLQHTFAADWKIATPFSASED